MKKIVTLILAIGMAYGVHAKKTKVKIETNYGTIVAMLYDNTPENSGNMIKQAKEHSYDSTLFHRVIPSFMIQGGDPDSKRALPGAALGSGGLSYRVPAEINDENYHKRGALAVARDNAPDKSGSACQFYIVVGKKFTDADLDNLTARTGRKFSAEQREMYKTVGGTPHLDGNYTVFGEVVEGMDVVDKIVNEARDSRDRPNNDVRILKLRVIKKKKFLLF